MNVLFTRTLSDFDIRLCAELGIVAHTKPLMESFPRGIETILANHPDLWETLNSVTAVAFTSQQAVDALFLLPNSEAGTSSDAASSFGANIPSGAGISSGAATSSGANSATPTDLNSLHAAFVSRLTAILRRKPVYTVGESTADSLDVHGIMARFPEDYNATTMARMMQNDGVHTAILHFCGDIRRPELTQAMTEASIVVHPVIVYEKQEVDFRGYFSDEVNLRRYLEHLSVVAFYSPTAVQAFFRQGLHNWFSGDYYVIGSTTMAALNAYGATAQMPRVPTSELLIRYIYKRLSGGSA